MSSPLGSCGEGRNRLRQLLFTLWLVLLSPGGMAADEGPIVRVDSLSFEGVDSVSEGDLRGAILTTAPDWRPWREHPIFDQEDLDQDLDRIAALYRDHGYFEATAVYSLEWEDDGDAVDIEIRVTEGAPVRLASWSLELAPGTTLAPETMESIREGIPARGSVFGVEVYRDVRALVLQKLANRGLPAAGLDGGADIDPNQKSASVEWVLDPGPVVVMGEVRLSGLVDVQPKVVLRELAFDTGERYSVTALRESERRIFETGLFRSVSIEPGRSDPTAAAAGEEGEPVVWPLVLTLVERPPRAFRVGVGYGTEDFFRGQARWTHRNFLGDGRRLSASGKASALIAGGEVEIVQPYLLDERIRVSLLGSATRDTPRAYSATRFSQKLGFEAPFQRHWSVRWGQGYEWANVTDQDKEFDDKDLPKKSGIMTFPVGLRRSTLDDPIEPSLGTWFDIDVEPSFRAVGSDVNYVKTTAEVRGFHSIGPTVLGARLRAGTLQPVGSSDRDDVPVFKRYFAGGSTSVRGFQYQKLGPLDDDDNDPLGGLSMAEGSIELRFPIWKRLYGAVFSDAGDVEEGPFGWKTSGIRYSSGLGLRLRTPVGPIRVDVARLYNPPSGISRYAYYISVGQAF